MKQSKIMSFNIGTKIGEYEATNKETGQKETKGKYGEIANFSLNVVADTKDESNAKAAMLKNFLEDQQISLRMLGNIFIMGDKPLTGFPQIFRKNTNPMPSAEPSSTPRGFR